MTPKRVERFFPMMKMHRNGTVQSINTVSIGKNICGHISAKYSHIIVVTSFSTKIMHHGDKIIDIAPDFVFFVSQAFFLKKKKQRRIFVQGVRLRFKFNF